MKRMQLTGIALLLMTGIPVISMAQDKVEADIGADLVSGYIWRGQDLGNVSIQPSASVSYKGFSLSAGVLSDWIKKTPRNSTLL